MPAWSDKEVEALVGRLLQVGVVSAAVVVLAGGVLFLIQHGGDVPDHHEFHGEKHALKSLPDIADGAVHLDSRALIQLGLVLLILTPVARVAFTVFVFLWQRDYIFVAVTLLVLSVLIYSQLSGYFGM